MILSPKKQFLITTVAEGSDQIIRLYIDFYQPNNPQKIQQHFKLAQIYLLTQKASYFCNLRKSDIALSWNLSLYHRLKNVFSEKSGSLILNFDEDEKFFSVSTENELRAIRFLLFQKENITLLDQNPTLRMQKLLSKFHYQKHDILGQLCRKEEQEQEKINKIDALTRQVKDAANDEVIQMKDRFIPLINKIKEQLRSKRNQEDEEGIQEKGREEKEGLSKGEQKNRKMLKILGIKNKGDQNLISENNQLSKIDEELCIQDQFLDIL